MRRLASSLAAALLVGGCASGAATTPVPAVPTDAPPAAATPTAEPPCKGSGCPPADPPAQVSARVTFDGTRCDYTGPTVIALPATLTIEFAPADETYALAVDAVLASTTRADVDRVNADEAYGPAPGKQQPEFTIPGALNRVMGTMSFDTELRAVTTDAGTYDQYAIMCIRTPWAAGMPADEPENRVTGALLRVVEE